MPLLKPKQCDVVGCPQKFSTYRKTPKSIFNEIQNHLWMSHHVDVIESHERARRIIEPKKIEGENARPR